MEDRKREVSGKHALKLILLTRTLALKGPSSKYDLSKHDHSREEKKGKKKEVKFSWPLVHKLLRELIENGRVQEYGEKKAKKHKTTLYGLSFFGLLCYFAGKHRINALVDQKEKEKTIENYSDVHPIFKHWKKLEKSISSQNALYDALEYASFTTLGLLRERGSISFEPHYPLPLFIEEAKETFTMNLFRCLSREHKQVNELSIPEIYEYSKNILDERRKEFENIEKLILKFK